MFQIANITTKSIATMKSEVPRIWWWKRDNPSSSHSYLFAPPNSSTYDLLALGQWAKYSTPLQLIPRKCGESFLTSEFTGGGLGQGFPWWLRWWRTWDASSILRWGRSSAGGHGNPLQYSCLENPMDRGAWRATVHRVARSQTQLKRLSITHAQVRTGSQLGCLPFLRCVQGHMYHKAVWRDLRLRRSPYPVKDSLLHLRNQHDWLSWEAHALGFSLAAVLGILYWSLCPPPPSLACLQPLEDLTESLSWTASGG